MHWPRNHTRLILLALTISASGLIALQASPNRGSADYDVDHQIINGNGELTSSTNYEVQAFQQNVGVEFVTTESTDYSVTPLLLAEEPTPTSSVGDWMLIE